MNTSDVTESFLASHCRVRVKSPLSRNHINIFRFRSESQELSSNFESLVCKLESRGARRRGWGGYSPPL